MKRKHLILALLIGITLSLSFTAVSSAAGYSCVPATGCKGVCTVQKFFNLAPWYQYLTLKSSDDGKYCQPDFRLLPNGSAPSSVPLVLLAILDDLVRIAAFAAVLFVIWGGVKYMTSQGSPDATKQAQQTIINAVIGLVIAILATAVVSFVGRRIIGS